MGEDEDVAMLHEVPCHDGIRGSGKTEQHILTTPLDARQGVSFTSRKVYPLQGVPGTH
jgi:hypothetical protein